MLIIPALDLYQKKVVRFVKGAPQSCKVYSDNPIEIAKKWQAEGAKLLHIVDLSSALGEGDNFKMIKEILRELKIKVEVGGGIRSLDKAKELISLGAERIIIGTKGLDEKFLDRLIISLDKEKLAVSVDILNSSLAVEGWQKKTKVKGFDFIAHLKGKGIKWIIYTDISRDGTLDGPNLKEAKKLSVFSGMNFIISGGVSSLDDLKRVKDEVPFAWGVILGRALYDEKIDLKSALSLE